MGDATSDPVRLSFNPKLRVAFRGDTVTAERRASRSSSTLRWFETDVPAEERNYQAAAVQDGRTPRPACPVLSLQLAERSLTGPLFRQIVARSERLAWQPT